MRKIWMFVFVILLVGIVFGAGNNSGNSNNANLNNTGQVQESNNNDLIQIRNTEQFREKIQNKEYICNCSGSELRIKAMNSTRTQLKVKNITAQSDMNFSEETNGTQTKLKAQLSNGRNAEIKIMPDTASERALERLRLRVCNITNNCTIELKEVGKENSTRVAYEVHVEKHSKIFGLFRKTMRVHAQIDAETGEYIGKGNPWWAFLATEQDDFEDEENSLITREEARNIAEKSECINNSSLKETYVYNKGTRTWWFDMNLEKEGCNPACVVNEETLTAEINWRCTGLIEDQE